MSQSVKLSDDLICDARLVGEVSQRSLAGQIEFWAALGRAIEPTLRGDRALALRRAGAEVPLSELIATVASDRGRERVRHYLDSVPYPHFESVAGSPGLFRKTEADGTVSIGRFVNRKFVLDQ